MSPLIFTLIVVGGLMLGLFQERIAHEIIMLIALLVLVAGGVISLPEAMKGFSNPGVLTIGALFVVGAGIQATGAVEYISRALLGRPQPGTSLLRLIVPVAVLSAFLNNTPIVAFFLPIFVTAARKMRTSPSKLLIPLSYAAILGGTCTKIGTSTNFSVDTAMTAVGMPGMTMWEISYIGIPVSVAALLFLQIAGRRLLPDRTDLLDYAESHPREYTLELIARSTCPLVGKTIRDSGLRELPGLYVYAIERRGERLSPVSPDERIQSNDILCFSGVVGTIVDAQKIRGLEPVDHTVRTRLEEAASLDSFEGIPSTPAPSPRSGQQLCEVVISGASPLVGHTVKEADFRSHYQASIIAVHRSGEKLEQKIGQIELQPGDTLLVDAPHDFARRWRNSRDFILVSGVEDSAPIDHHRAWLALAVFLGVILGMSFAPEDKTALVALLGAVVMLATGCLATSDAYRSVELSVLIMIASALGVSFALTKSGAADFLATTLIGWAAPFGKIAVLAVIVVMTGLLTELLSNNACAALMSALVLSLAPKLGIDPRPLLLAVAVTSSYGFSTPIGYQTNLMVLGPGGYKFSDYLRVGIPLDLLCWTMTILIVGLFGNM